MEGGLHFVTVPDPLNYLVSPFSGTLFSGFTFPLLVQ